jgi:ankyrin repeat protein
LADSVDKDGASALHVAAGEAKREVVDWLLSKGADLGARTAAGLTPLHVAAQGGNDDVVRFLIKRGTEVDAKDKSGVTPLLAAAKGGRASAAILLIDAGADVNVTAESSPLICAIIKNRPELVEHLIKAGADVNRVTVIKFPGLVAGDRRISMKPLDEAEKTRNPAIIQMLRQAGAEKMSLSEAL